MKLAGQRSPRWAFMERFEVPNLDDPAETYLTRWRLIQTPWFAIYLHRMNGPDSRPTLHDHPWPFLSLILRGGYEETYVEQPWRADDVSEPDILLANMTDLRAWRVGTIHRMRARSAHYIYRLLRYPTWTLLLVGPRVRTWGYWDAAGWTPYDQHPHAAEFDRAMASRAKRAEQSHG